jgi:diguanylate cyclase (GGDEF)-like protein/PAS domain S-box-containing protein
VTDGSIAIPYKSMLDALEVAVVALDQQGRVVAANRRARDEFAVMGESVSADGFFVKPIEFIGEHGDRLRGHELPTTRTLREGTVLRDFLMGVRIADAPLMWVTVGTSPQRDPDDGAITAVICTFVDVTEQRRVEGELRASEERFRLIAENAADVVYRFTVGDTPRFDYVNPAVESQLGYTPQEFYDDPSLIVKVTHDDDIELVRTLGHAGVDAARSMQLRMVRRDGTQIWTEHKVVPLRDSSGEVIAATGIARDVTALKVKEAFLSHRALHDALTGLPNRVLLLDRLEAALARIRRHQSYLAVLYLDLDRFKTVNDNLGHEIGDRLLQVVGQRLQQTLRPSDSVARLGGDEFVAVLADLHDPSEAMQVAERLLTVIAEPADFGDSPLVCTVSIGIAGTDDGDATAGELLRRADFAMYTAKDRGRARVEWYEHPDS